MTGTTAAITSNPWCCASCGGCKVPVLECWAAGATATATAIATAACTQVLRTRRRRPSSFWPPCREHTPGCLTPVRPTGPPARAYPPGVADNQKKRNVISWVATAPGTPTHPPKPLPQGLPRSPLPITTVGVAAPAAKYFSCAKPTPRRPLHVPVFLSVWLTVGWPCLTPSLPALTTLTIHLIFTSSFPLVDSLSLPYLGHRCALCFHVVLLASLARALLCLSIVIRSFFFSFCGHLRDRLVLAPSTFCQRTLSLRDSRSSPVLCPTCFAP